MLSISHTFLVIYSHYYSHVYVYIYIYIYNIYIYYIYIIYTLVPTIISMKNITSTYTNQMGIHGNIHDIYIHLHESSHDISMDISIFPRVQTRQLHPHHWWRTSSWASPSPSPAASRVRAEGWRPTPSPWAPWPRSGGEDMGEVWDKYGISMGKYRKI